MKDYYKILGVDEGATEEEIRQRWVRLIKHYHPDVRRGQKNDEKIKEINEAYEVLSDFSKRFDYDFKRNLKKSLNRKGFRSQWKRAHFTKIIGSFGVFLILLIVGFVIVKWPTPTKPPQTATLHPKDQGVGEKSLSTPSFTKKEPVVPMEKELPGKGDEILPQKNRRVAIQTSESPPKPEGESKKGPISSQQESGLVERIFSPPLLKPEILPEEEITKEVSTEGQKENQIEVSKEVPKDISPKEKLKEILPYLLAKEEEVRQFLSDYKDRYTQRDIQGFMALFSSRAIQNQKDGYEEIMKIYHRFFDQSQVLHYHLDNPKIEIYENIVEIKARYKVDQILKNRGREKVWMGNIRWVLERENGLLKIVNLDYQHDRPL